MVFPFTLQEDFTNTSAKFLFNPHGDDNCFSPAPRDMSISKAGRENRELVTGRSFDFKISNIESFEPK